MIVHIDDPMLFQDYVAGSGKVEGGDAEEVAAY
jgi:hypothetical protein